MKAKFHLCINMRKNKIRHVQDYKGQRAGTVFGSYY